MEAVLAGTKPTLKSGKRRKRIPRVCLPKKLTRVDSLLHDQAVFQFEYEAYFEVKETPQTQPSRLLAEKAHDG